MIETEVGRLSLQIKKKAILIKDNVTGSTTCIGVQSQVLHANLAEEENHLVVVTKKGLLVYEHGRDAWLQMLDENIQPGVKSVRWVPLMNPTFVLEYEDGSEVRFVQAGKWKRV